MPFHTAAAFKIFIDLMYARNHFRQVEKVDFDNFLLLLYVLKLLLKLMRKSSVFQLIFF